MTSTEVIFRVSRMECLYKRYLTESREELFHHLKKYYYSQWADDRDFIFAETDLSYNIFQPHRLNQLIEQKEQISL
ncbi:hypothetical protein [Macrococcus lamae]|uniref:Uncharacterized protein n=1 Tax=Macrococcus lamae TaxID=198484 RepID=A0A4R6BUZ1_9STAP|nr:hypothetical protein [Macrococcus lamae]TDM12069.1 hypothetical protein ERX29_04425 [Macrococcus lamae]